MRISREMLAPREEKLRVRGFHGFGTEQLVFFEANAQGTAAQGDKAEEITEKELEAVSGGDESPKETVNLGYGGLQVHYSPQKPDGSI